MLELFMYLMFGLLVLLLNFCSLWVSFFFQICDFKFLAFFAINYIFPWICTIVSMFFPTKISNLKRLKTKNKKVPGGGIQTI